MHSKKEIILHFPLIKYLKQGKSREKENDKIKNLKEKELYVKHVTENEWHQEYYLIYNSYILDNGC
jgi:hypothetical protein